MSVKMVPAGCKATRQNASGCVHVRRLALVSAATLGSTIPTVSGKLQMKRTTPYSAYPETLGKHPAFVWPSDEDGYVPEAAVVFQGTGDETGPWTTRQEHDVPNERHEIQQTETHHKDAASKEAWDKSKVGWALARKGMLAYNLVEWSATRSVMVNTAFVGLTAGYDAVAKGKAGVETAPTIMGCLSSYIQWRAAQEGEWYTIGQFVGHNWNKLRGNEVSGGASSAADLTEAISMSSEEAATAWGEVVLRSVGVLGAASFALTWMYSGFPLAVLNYFNKPDVKVGYINITNYTGEWVFLEPQRTYPGGTGEVEWYNCDTSERVTTDVAEKGFFF